MGEIVVLVTTGSQEEGIKLSRILVEKKLAACVNMIPGVRSIYQWNGKVTEDQEILLVIKSVDQAFDQLASAVKTNHSYSVPEIIALPIQHGSEDYLAWIRHTTENRPTHAEE